MALYTVGMRTKNRMIRADDDLWTRVTTAAEKLGKSTSQFVRLALWRATEERYCAICGDPANVERSVPIDGWGGETLEQMAMRAKAGDASFAKSSFVAITFDVCARHDDGASDYFLDRTGGVQGYTIAQDGRAPGWRPSVNPESDPAYQRMAEIMQKVHQWSSRPDGA